MNFHAISDTNATTSPGSEPVQQVVINSLNTAIVLLNHELEVILINQAAESLLDLSEKQVLGQKLPSKLPGWKDIESLLYESLQTDQIYTKRQNQIHLAGSSSVTVDFTITPISDNEWPRLLIELTPIDRYLRIDRDALTREQQAATRQIMRGVAHEIKNPLGGIRGSAQLLAAELPDPSLNEYTEIIIEETDRLKTLVDRMLGPNTPSTLAPGNIHEILEKVRRLIELEVDYPLEVTRDYDPSIPVLLIDGDLMFQAILNILRNAMQAMDNRDNARMVLKTRTERQFTIAGLRHRNVLRIQIIDNGPGIPAHLKDHLFLPMISGRPSGTGLGLSLAHTIIHQHRGVIELNSEPGHTEFTIIIPLEIAKS